MLTPNELRERTLKANNGFASAEAAKKAAWEEDRFRRAIANCEKDAAEQAALGKDWAVGFECTAHGGENKFEDLPAQDRAMFERLRKHYEKLGFKTRIHGPYTDGGPGHVTIGFDLMVGWGDA